MTALDKTETNLVQAQSALSLGLSPQLQRLVLDGCRPAKPRV